MWISNLRIQNLKSIADSGEIALSRGINNFVGSNNAGKSTVLRALNRLQYSSAVTLTDVRQGTNQFSLTIQFEQIQIENKLGMDPLAMNNLENLVGTCTFVLGANGQQTGFSIQTALGNLNFGQIQANEPRNFIFPYLSKRKVPTLEQAVNAVNATVVLDNLSNLVSKVDDLRDTQHPAHEEFARSCRDILGFEVSTFASTNGKQVGLLTSMYGRIPLDAMGEGTAHLLGLIAQLCVADQQLFLIEEIENDIHPRALKGLLRLIAYKAERNQFVLSTHSNIVTKYLGAETGARVFSVSMEINDRLPITSIRLVGDDPAERRAILEDLGYETSDFGMWQGYLFFEESSAEKIVREHLIRWFAPGLQGTLKTIASIGVSQIQPKFENLNRLFLFTHLEPMYRDRAWVVADGDDAGKDVVNRLRQKYGGTWAPEHFRNWSEENFERYYPEDFKQQVEEVLATPDNNARRERKKALLEMVLGWIQENDGHAKIEFERSAAEVISLLRDIELQLAAR